MKKRYIKIIIFTLILLFYFIFLFHRISLITDDLGRHITNGKILLSGNKEILYKNFYSSNYSDFVFINHHWFFGVLSYLFYLIGSFEILVIIKILIFLVSFSLLFYLSMKKSDFFITALISIPLILVLTERTDFRPEIFSYLFIILFLFILYDFLSNGKSKNIWFLPLIQLIWVNMHSYFFIGIFLVSVFLIQIIIKEKSIKSEQFKKLFIVFILILVICLVNPNFLKGAIYPFRIFEDYGYELAENQTPFFMYSLMRNPRIEAYFFVLFLFLISFFLILKKQSFSNILLALFAISTSFFALRNLTLFGIIIMPLLTENLYDINEKYQFKKRYILIFVLIIILIIGFIVIRNYDILFKEFGLGLSRQSENSGEFFNQHNLSGKIFNNYDIGSYLIFYHFPDSSVFVDNRPEAYPGDFFNNTYRPIQLDEEKWKEIMQKENLSIIYFSHQEGTYWGYNFLYKRINDEDWCVIHINKYAIILLKQEFNPELCKQDITSKNVQEKISFLLESDNKKDIKIGADILEFFDRYDLAIQVYESLLEKNPKDGEILIRLGSIYASMNNTNMEKKATEFYERAISSGFKKSRIYNQLGLIYFNLQEYEKAKKSWRKALFVNPFDKTAKDYLKQFKELEIVYGFGQD